MAKKQLKDYKFVPAAVPPSYGDFPSAVSLITANRDYIVEEIMGYMTSKFNTPSYHTAAGNKTTYAQALLLANKEFIKEEACAFVTYNIANNNAPFIGYTFNATKCKRDIGYLIDAFLEDLEGGGNFETIRIARMFYLNGTAQLLSPSQEAAVHNFVKLLISSYVLSNTAYDSKQNIAPQVTTDNNGEDDANSKLSALNDIVINLITSGVSSLPAIEYNFDLTWAERVYGASKCKRDIAYILEGVGLDIALGSNYNAIFLGRAEANSKDYTTTVSGYINAARAQVLALSAVSSSAEAIAQVNSDFDDITAIAEAGVGGSVSYGLAYADPSSATTSQIAAKDKLLANKAFIQAEVNAWVGATYPSHNHDEAKCSRDVGYAIDALCYDILYGGNQATYDSAKFFNYAGVVNISDEHLAQTVAAYGRLKIIVGAIVQGSAISKTTTGTTPNTLTQDTSGNAADPAEAAILEDLIQVIADVVANGNSSLPATRILPSVAFATTALQNAKSAIDAASTTIQNTVVDYVDYTYDASKCRRDSYYIVDAYIYDMTYGGNSSSYYVASQYQINNIAQVVRPEVEVEVQTWARDLINNYVLQNKYHASYQWTAYQTVNTSINIEADADNKITELSDIIINCISGGLSTLPKAVSPDNQNGGLMSQAVSLLEANKRYIQEETIAYIQYNIDNNINPYVYFTYNSSKCYRDVSYVLEGYISDLKQGGNRQTVFNASKYFEGGVAQVDGNRLPESYAHTFIRDLIENFIWTNTPYSSKQTQVSQTFNYNIEIETFANSRLKELTNSIINVITYGLDYLPPVVSNRGYIKIPGFYKAKDFLLITNANRNRIMYNFADPLTAAEVTYYESDNDVDFPAVYYGTDKITTVTFSTNTADMMVTDNIQIFVEGKEQVVKMNNSSQDAMERVKVGIPQSMLDADFEYGLQPTKWQALAMLRNYPAIYEIPGSDQPVVSVVTDASTGTGSAGSSLITVTTVASHGFVVGDAFTIKALANTVSGFSRAEGSFLVNSVPSLNTFTYWAKSKVGTSNGQVLATSYTQLRKGQFYTNASVGNPTFSVYSSGSSGTVTTSLITPSGATTIGYTGSPPPIGSPVSGTGITPGTQVTSASGSGGVAASTKLAIAASIGDTSVTVVSTTGLSQGLVYDRGDGVAVVVTGINGQVVSLSGPLTSNVLGNTQTYSSVSQGSGSTTSGTGAIFNISRSGSTYTSVISNAGSGYAPGNTLVVHGTSLGGLSPDNDATVTVATASSLYPVTSLGSVNSGTGGWGDLVNPGQALGVSTTGIAGTGLTINVIDDGSGNVSSVSVASGGVHYQVGDVVTVLGSTNSTDDLTVAVTSIDSTGAVLGIGLPTIGLGLYSASTNPHSTSTTTTSFGTGLTLDATYDASGFVTSVAINNPGAGYTIYDAVQLVGGNNNTTVYITGVTLGGLITSVSTAGTPITAPTKDFISAFTISEPTTSQLANGNTGITYSSIATIQVTFASNHGFVPGNTITVQITSAGTGAQLAAGAYFVEQVPGPTIIRYTARAAGTIDNTLVGNIYARPDSFFVHRPFDGGVQLGTASPSHSATAIRMSKKYIRYQSGKGVMYNTGALFAPSYDIRTITANGTAIGSVITLTTDDTDHGCQIGGIIKVVGVETSGYDGEYTVINILNERQLQVLAQKKLASTTGAIGSPCYMSIRKWHGSTVRSGIFDDQNGMFWQYDGQRMAVVRRSSTFQIAGTINISPNSNLVTGNNTRFTSQLAQGDRIVIRGMTHIVSKIDSDTSMTVTPDFRGVVEVQGTKVAKTIDLVIPQEDWNLDALNGTGASGYVLDPTKMQMIGIQHTWYGAGFIDFMLRGPEGNYTWAHRFRNSNVNTEAYMRTGNQPVRYEVINEGAKGRLSTAANSTQDYLELFENDCYWFPDSGVVYVDNELIRYTGKTLTRLTGCTRAAGLTQFVAGSQRTFTAGAAASHNLYAGVTLVSNTITPNISHWGSAFMIDGQFDSDRGYIFNYASTAINVSVDKATAFLIRLAPSVSNAQIGDLGEKELLNRAQLLLSSIAITSDAVSGGGGIVVEGVLNPSNYPTDPTKITWTGLASSAAGGQPSFAQIAAGGSVSWSGNITTSTANVQGAFTTTLAAKAFNLITANLTATSFSATTQSLVARSFAPASNATYTRAFDNTRNDFLLLQSEVDAAGTTITSGDTLLVLGDSGTLASVNALGSSLSFVSKTGTGPFIVTFNLGTTQPWAPVAGQTAYVYGATQNGYNGTVTIVSGTTSQVVLSYSSDPGTYISGGTITFGNFSCTTFANGLYVGETVTLSGTLGGSTGAISGYGNPTTYYVVNTNGSTQFQLSTTYGGQPVTITTAGAMTSNATWTVRSFVRSSQTVSSYTPNYITIGASSYARIVMSAVPTLSSGTATSDGQYNVSIRFTSALATAYSTAISNARTDFLIPQTQYAATTIAAADVLSATTYLTGGQTVSTSTANYCKIGGTTYARIVMTSNGTATSAAGTGNNITVTITNSVSNTYNRALSTSRLDFLITDTEYDLSGIQTSDVLSVATYLTAGQTIGSITRSYLNISGTNYTRIVMNAVPNANSTGGAGNDISVTVTAAGTAASYVKTNYLYFTSASWLASGATVGTRLASSYTSFPAGTAVTGLTTRTLGGVTVYRVVFTQSANTTISAGAQPTFQFGAAYALPGEQVFSFIANPGESNVLSLEALKELTATAIGGRGTFPNGPDVLAINIYKVAGSATSANLILRWGEAQA